MRDAVGHGWHVVGSRWESVAMAPRHASPSSPPRGRELFLLLSGVLYTVMITLIQSFHPLDVNKDLYRASENKIDSCCWIF